MGLNIDLLSLNVRGIRNYKKCRKTLNWLVKHGGNRGISFLQETHSTPDVENEWKQRFRGDVYLSHGTSLSKRVAILVGEKLDYKVLSLTNYQDGRLLIS